MAESIKKFKTYDELISDLKNRNLIFPDRESMEIFKLYLMQYGYFSFIKKLSNDLMYSDREKKLFKSEFTSNNLRYLFDLDRNISIIFFKYFRNIEFLFNTSLLKVISKNINKFAKCPYLAALDNESFSKIFPKIDEEMPQAKRWAQNIFLNFYDDLFKNFNNVDFDSRDAIRINKNNEPNEIKELIEKGWFGNFITEQKKKNIKRFNSDWKYFDIFSLFQTLSFSQLIRLFSYLSTSLKNEVIKEFLNDYKPSNKKLRIKEDDFRILLQIFVDLRNTIMHNGAIIKFNFKSNDKPLDEIIKYFNLDNESNKIRLNEIVLIMQGIIKFKTENQIIDEIVNVVKIKYQNRSERKDQISNLIIKILVKETGMEFLNKIDIKNI